MTAQLSPRIIAESAHWALVFKPHNMPTAPLVAHERGTLLEWVIARYPHAVNVRGKKEIEHGLIHRLDTPTEGLVLLALNQLSYEHFQKEQKAERIVKGYEATCSFQGTVPIETVPRVIESRFRPYGKGSKMVKPLFPGDRRFDKAGKDYRTIISGIKKDNDRYRLTCEIVSGFRHQIRAHLAHLGYPILGDSLYNPFPGDGNLELSAVEIRFIDPETYREVSFSLH